MQTERLLKLADYLEKEVEPHRLLMGSWGYESEECGTTACAFGWATTIPEFKELGLNTIRSGCAGVTELTPEFDEALGFSAAELFFGITRNQAMWLFSPGQYYTPRRIEIDDVVRRLRWVAENPNTPLELKG